MARTLGTIDQKIEKILNLISREGEKGIKFNQLLKKLQKKGEMQSSNTLNRYLKTHVAKFVERQEREDGVYWVLNEKGQNKLNEIRTTEEFQDRFIEPYVIDKTSDARIIKQGVTLIWKEENGSLDKVLISFTEEQGKQFRGETGKTVLDEFVKGVNGLFEKLLKETS